MQHLGTRRLETERLVLRRFNINDVHSSFENWTSDEKVTPYVSWRTHIGEFVTKEILSMWIAAYDEVDFYQWAICLKDSDEVIGTISVVRKDHNIQEVEIGYALGSAFWGQGIATEAFKELIRFFFEEVGLNRVAARHDVENSMSEKVMKKAGLTYEGTLRQAVNNKGELRDVKVYSILKEEFEKKGLFGLLG